MSKEAFIVFRERLIKAITTHPDFIKARASGNFERFINSEQSIGELTDEKFIQLGTPYTVALDVGTEKGKANFRGIYDWLQYQKYGIRYQSDNERRSVAWAIFRKHKSLGSYKRRNESARTKIISDAIEQSLPTLRVALLKSSIKSLNSPIKAEIDRINGKPV